MHAVHCTAQPNKSDWLTDHCLPSSWFYFIWSCFLFFFQGFTINTCAHVLSPYQGRRKRGTEGLPPKLLADQLALYQSGREGGRLSPTGFSDLPMALPYPEAAAQKSLFDYYFFFFFFIIHTWKKPATHKLPFGRNTGCFRTNIRIIWFYVRTDLSHTNIYKQCSP